MWHQPVDDKSISLHCHDSNLIWTRYDHGVLYRQQNIMVGLMGQKASQSSLLSFCSDGGAMLGFQEQGDKRLGITYREEADGVDGLLINLVETHFDCI